jgi:hypothetical protein
LIIGTNNHDGNVNFRNLVNQHKMRYLASSKIDKPKVAREVVRIWKCLSPPGRFLQKKEGTTTAAAADGSGTPTSDGGSGESSEAVWVEVSDKKAREKASQCLRERTADVMPYLTQLQHQREQMREQGVSMISQHLAAAHKNGDGLPTGRPQGRYGSLNMQAAPIMSNSMGPQGSGMMMGGVGAMNQAPHNRRVSMPAGRSPATPVTPMTSNGTPADRRMSMPVGGSGRKASAGRMTGNIGMAAHSMEQRVLQDAYSAIERSGGPDPANVMYMEQLLQEERMMEREAMMAERQILVGVGDIFMCCWFECLFFHVCEFFVQSSCTDTWIPTLINVSSVQMQERMMMQQERMMMQQRMNEQMSPYGRGQPAGSMMMMGSGGWSPMGGAGSNVPPNYNDIMFQQQQMMMTAHEQQQMMLQQQHVPGNSDLTPNSAMSGDQMEQNYSSRDSGMSGSGNQVHVGDHHRTVNVDGRPGVVTVVDMEPIPYLEDGSANGDIPLSIIPDVTKSLSAGDKEGRGQGSSTKRSPAVEKGKKKTGPERDHSKPAPKGPPSAKASNLSNRGDTHEETVIPLKDPPASSPRKLKSAFKRSTGSPRAKRGNTKAGVAPAVASGAAASSQQPTDEACLVEYRKTLENYMSAHKINAPAAVDTLIDDDISDDEEDIGVDASAWVAQTLNDSGDVSFNNSKKKKRTKKDHNHGQFHRDDHGLRSSTGEPERGVARNKSNESLMSTDVRSFDGKSMDGMSLMSLAISEMEEKDRRDIGKPKEHIEGGHDSMESMEEESVDFTGRDNKITGGRSMSSNHSVMSELTDFSDSGDRIDSDDEDDVVL